MWTTWPFCVDICVDTAIIVAGPQDSVDFALPMPVQDGHKAQGHEVLNGSVHGLGRDVQLGGDSSWPITIAQSIKDCQPLQLVQWLVLSGAGWFFTQSIQFFRYWRFLRISSLPCSGGLVVSFLWPFCVNSVLMESFLPDTLH